MLAAALAWTVAVAVKPADGFAVTFAVAVALPAGALAVTVAVAVVGTGYVFVTVQVSVNVPDVVYWCVALADVPATVEAPSPHVQA